MISTTWGIDHILIQLTTLNFKCAVPPLNENNELHLKLQLSATLTFYIRDCITALSASCTAQRGRGVQGRACIHRQHRQHWWQEDQQSNHRQPQVVPRLNKDLATTHRNGGGSIARPLTLHILIRPYKSDCSFEPPVTTDITHRLQLVSYTITILRAQLNKA